MAVSAEEDKLKDRPTVEKYASIPAEEKQSMKGVPLLYGLLTVFLCAVAFIIGAKNPSILDGSSASLRDGATSEVDEAHIILEPLWATSLIRSHLRTHPGIPDIKEFNRRLADVVTRDHDAYLKEKSADFDDISTKEKELLNDDFFVHQVGSPDEPDDVVKDRLNAMEHRHSAEFQLLTNCVADMANRVLEKFGEGVAESSEKRLQSWITLHRNGSRHAMHVHPQSTLSIVYYVQLAEVGGAIHLHDPRGPRPPFEDKIEFLPEEGEIILFPGWVAHEVDASIGTRISIVFNVAGPWEGTRLGGLIESLGQWHVERFPGVQKVRRPRDWVLDYEL